jgi:hypothetical protein
MLRTQVKRCHRKETPIGLLLVEIQSDAASDTEREVIVLDAANSVLELIRGCDILAIRSHSQISVLVDAATVEGITNLGDRVADSLGLEPTIEVDGKALNVRFFVGGGLLEPKTTQQQMLQRLEELAAMSIEAAKEQVDSRFRLSCDQTCSVPELAQGKFFTVNGSKRKATLDDQTDSGRNRLERSQDQPDHGCDVIKISDHI